MIVSPEMLGGETILVCLTILYSHFNILAMDFCLPIDITRLQNDRLWLLPFEQCTQYNLKEFIEETCIKNPEVWDYYPGGPFTSFEDYTKWMSRVCGSSPEAQRANQIFAIFLKAGKVRRKRPGSDEVDTFEVQHGTFAGTTGLVGASAEMSKAEIGHVIVLPQFQRTFVNTQACFLLLKHLLDPLEGGDLNMRRVQWTANSENKASVRAAENLGMTLEGIIRWDRVLDDHKKCVTELRNSRSEGKPVVDKTGWRLGPGKHTAMLSMCWDDWLNGKRDHVMSLLARE